MIYFIIYILGIIASISISAFYNRKHIKKYKFSLSSNAFFFLSIFSWATAISITIVMIFDIYIIDNFKFLQDIIDKIYGIK